MANDWDENLYGFPSGYRVGRNFTPHLITVGDGQDVADTITQFAQQDDRAVIVLSAVGSVSWVTLRELSHETSTYQGRFAIISISGSLVPVDNGSKTSRIGGFMIMFQGPDGRVLGGRIGGKLTAFGPVRLELGSFLPGYCPNPQELEETSVKKRKLYSIHESEGESSHQEAGMTLSIKKEPIEWSDEEENGGDREQKEGFTAPINHEVEEAGGVEGEEGGDRVKRAEQLKGLRQGAGEEDNAGDIVISASSGISPSRLVNSSFFPNFQAMGDALSLIVTEGMAARGVSTSRAPPKEDGLIAPLIMPESSNCAALNNLYFSFANGGWGEILASPVTGQVVGEGSRYQAFEGFTMCQNSGYLPFSMLNLGNNVNAGKATRSNSPEPLNPDNNANQGEKATGSISFTGFDIGNNAKQGQAAGFFSFPPYAVKENDSLVETSESSDGSPSKYLDFSSCDN